MPIDRLAILRNAEKLLRQGKQDSRDFTDAQNALLQAQDAYEQANASFQIQVLGFLRDTGTLGSIRMPAPSGQPSTARPIR